MTIEQSLAEAKAKHWKFSAQATEAAKLRDVHHNEVDRLENALKVALNDYAKENS